MFLSGSDFGNTKPKVVRAKTKAYARMWCPLCGNTELEIIMNSKAAYKCDCYDKPFQIIYLDSEFK